MGIQPNELLIDDDTNNDLLFKYRIDGKEYATGCIPRDYDVQPVEMFAPPSDMKLIPRSEWSDRIKEQEKRKSRISDVLLRAGIPSTDQNGHGYCWAYSVVGALQASRALAGQAHVPLNAHSVAAIIKKGADQGGWCGLSAAFVREHGVADFDHWPEHSRDYRKHDTPACRANMALHKSTEEYVDLTRNVYDQNLTLDQIATCCFDCEPMAWDFAWWGHSVMGCDLVEVEPGDFGLRLRNNWKDSYGVKGFAVIRGSKIKTMGAIAIRQARAHK